MTIKDRILQELGYISFKLDSFADTDEAQELLERLDACIDEIYTEWKTKDESHYLRINIEDEVCNNIYSFEPDEEITPEEMDKIVNRAKYYISGDERFWSAYNNCVNDAIIDIRHEQNKTT